MRKNISAREWWGRYGLWTAVFLSILCAHPATYRAFGGGTGRFVIAFSITLSIATLLHTLCNVSDFTRFYRPYVVKWISWFIANSLLSFVMFGLICVIALTCLFGFSEGLNVGFPLLVLVLPFPVYRLCGEIRKDLGEIREFATLHGRAAWLSVTFP